MHECVVRLLRSSSDEESLECFAGLITTTGKDLDHPEAKVGKCVCVCVKEKDRVCSGVGVERETVANRSSNYL